MAGSPAVNQRTARRLLVSLVATVVLASSWVMPGAVPARQAAGATTAQGGEVTALRLATPVLSARRTPELMAHLESQRALGVELDGVLADAPPDSCIVVADDTGGLYQRNAERGLIPASTMKLVTAAVAVEVLGGDRRWTTSARSARPPTAGVVDGDLFVVGGGDPLLATSGYAASLPDSLLRLTSPFEQLADQVVAAGVNRITGSVLGDGSRHDSQPSVASWPAGYSQGPTVGALGALRVNAGRTGWADDPTVVSPGGGAGPPALLAAQTFTRLLQERGVTVDGAADVSLTPPDSQLVATMTSPTLEAMLEELLAWSDNGMAEILVKELGLAVSGKPTTEAGMSVIAATLAGWGIGVEGLALVDGSGLDTGNRLSCALLLAVLSQPGQSPGDGDDVVLDHLARPGNPGTLWGRLNEPAAIGRVRAKTGTLDTVRALTGDVASATAGRVRFAFIANDVEQGAGLSHDTADAMVRALLKFPQRPPVEMLGPASPTLAP
jgi:serine-type D-Ala-D-Ala carboxypeptidase/endopeptidase (penicillin-binding protein 4)